MILTKLHYSQPLIVFTRQYVVMQPTRRSHNIPYENADNEPPFEIPKTWVWVSHNELFEISGGSQPPKSKFSETPKPGYVRLYQIRDYGPHPIPVYIPEAMASKTTVKGDILLARYGASLGKVFFAEDGAYNVAMAKVIKLYSGSWIDDMYLYYYYQSDIYQSLVKGNSRSAQAGFNKEDLDELWFPLPPLDEQRRIVQAIETIIPYCVEYANKHEELEALNEAFPAGLKKSILQWAVQGKLVPQDPSDEPAEALLERIRGEKERLVREGKIKKDKHESVIFRRDNSHYEKRGAEIVCIDDEIPFDIPDTWEWCRLKDLAIINGGFAFKSTGFAENGTRVIRISDFNENGFVNNKVVRHAYIDDLEPYLLAEKNILLCMTGGTVGKSLFVLKLDEPMMTNQRVATIKIFGALEEYINIVILSPITQKIITGSKNSTNDNISMDVINNFLVPLPPLAEQHRIVESLEQILSISKQL